MTQKDKAKAYDEAIERAKKLKEDPQGVFYEYSPKEGDTICDYIFPELKESEDERIRKWLICGMNALKEQKTETFATIPIDDAIAWLEKQSEKLPMGFYFVNNEGKKFYSDTFRYGDVILQVEYDPFKHKKKNNYIDGCWQIRVYEPIPISKIQEIKL